MGASESKLAFKEDIFRLAGDENIPIDSQWWSRVCILLCTSLVACSLITDLQITTPQAYTDNNPSFSNFPKQRKMCRPCGHPMTSVV